ncbi:hypothetical protein [Pseudonocardia ailaonensis]|uniref:hypothetical protein n=1 Tax=Pseudonocardia ailaonensis TaxID=367279 RepID=UPI0031E1806D
MTVAAFAAWATVKTNQAQQQTLELQRQQLAQQEFDRKTSQARLVNFWITSSKRVEETSAGIEALKPIQVVFDIPDVVIKLMNSSPTPITLKSCEVVFKFWLTEGTDGEIPWTWREEIPVVTQLRNRVVTPTSDYPIELTVTRPNEFQERLEGRRQLAPAPTAKFREFASATLEFVDSAGFRWQKSLDGHIEQVEAQTDGSSDDATY